MVVGKSIVVAFGQQRTRHDAGAVAIARMIAQAWSRRIAGSRGGRPTVDGAAWGPFFHPNSVTNRSI
jgi:hypothetical protein